MQIYHRKKEIMRTLELIIIWLYTNWKFKTTRFCSVMVLLLFSFMFFIGLHDIDNAVNLRYIKLVSSEDYFWVDYNALGHGFTAEQLYIVGFIFVIVGFFGAIFTMHLFSRAKK